MPKKGHSEEQIVAVLRQVEAGARVEEVCRKAGISEATYYLWRRQYSGVGVSELRELRQLREENGRLKRLVADLSMDRGLPDQRAARGQVGAAGDQHAAVSEPQGVR